MLSLKTHALLLTIEIMTIMYMSAWRKKQVLRAEVIYLHLLLYSRLSPSLHYLCHHRYLGFITNNGQDAARCFI